MKKFLLLLVPLLLVTSCAGGTKRAADSEHNAADITFVQQMIPHHEQAVEMAELVDDADASPAVAALAEQIEGAQAPEIEQMTDWLTDWDVDESHGSGHGMDGMDEMDLGGLRATSGSAFDRLWLTMMITHHEGAVAMARTEIDEGQSQGAIALAKDIISAQEKEIATMKELLP